MTKPRIELTDIFHDQAEFMKAGDQTIGEFNASQKLLYQRLIREEYKEFFIAVEYEPLENQIKEANDMLVVITGWLHSVMPKAHKSWKLVNENNMLKVENPPVKDEHGKIMKSEEAIKSKSTMMKLLKELVK